MSRHPVEDSSSSAGLPVSPGLGPTLEAAAVGRRTMALTPRSLAIVALSVGIALVMVPVACALVFLIGFITNLACFGRLSGALVSQSGNELGWAVLCIPVLDSAVVGLMARYGSAAIRGHGIPEALGQILTNESRIPMRMTFLKPLSAAIGAQN